MVKAGARLVLANPSNGLAYPHDQICYFQSNHAHQMATAYFGLDAMPLSAVAHLLQGATWSLSMRRAAASH